MGQTAADIMTTSLVLLHPGDNVPKIAATLAEHHISAAPVVDGEGRVLGMVSEGDLMRRLGAGHATRRAWWLEMLAEGEDLAPDFLEYIRQETRSAAEVMTRDVVTVPETMPVAEIADLLMQRGIKRVPVLRAGKVVGIVSRADIVRTLAASRAGR